MLCHILTLPGSSFNLTTVLLKCWNMIGHVLGDLVIWKLETIGTGYLPTSPNYQIAESPNRVCGCSRMNLQLELFVAEKILYFHY